MPRLLALALLALLVLPTRSESGIYQTYQSLTAAEKRLALVYFWQLPDVYGAAEYARAESAGRYPNQSGQDDARDAYRHSLWNGSMVRRLRSLRAAERWGTAHEDFPANPAARRAMDLHNNARGRERTWARRTTRRVLFWQRHTLPSDDAIAADLRDALRTGDLVMVEELNGQRDPHAGRLVPSREP